MSTYQIKNKIITLNQAEETVKNLRKSGAKTVFTNGCFDVLHKGHIDYLRKSRQLGDLLIVGLNSDGSVKRLKGETRPINCERDRAFVLEALDFVDYIIIFGEDTPLELIQTLQPEIYTKGGDYDLKNVIGKGLGADIIEGYGGEVRLIPFTSGVSSTSIIEELKKNEQDS